MGNDDKSIHNRQDMEFSGKMDTKEIKEILCSMRMSSCEKEREVLDIVIRLVEKLEELFSD